MKSTWKARALAATKRVVFSKPALWLVGKLARNAKAVAAFLAPFLLRFVSQRIGHDVPLPIVEQMVGQLILAFIVWFTANRPPVKPPVDGTARALRTPVAVMAAVALVLAVAAVVPSGKVSAALTNCGYRLVTRWDGATYTQAMCTGGSSGHIVAFIDYYAGGGTVQRMYGREAAAGEYSTTSAAPAGRRAGYGAFRTP